MFRNSRKKSTQTGLVRVTAGEFKNMSLLTPGGGTHPMGDRERLALFNMIAEYVPGNFVLDAFCGGGTLGIEAVSRGAMLVVMLDKNKHACDIARSNLAELGIAYCFPPRAGVMEADIYETLADATDRFGIVLADPPYDDYDPEKIKVLARVVADPGGILVLSHPGEAPEMPGLVLQKSRKYAGATISVYFHENR